MLVLNMFALLWNMKKYHRFEYNLARNSIFVFCIFEVLPEVLFLVHSNKNNAVDELRIDLNYIASVVVITGTYPVIQALGIIYLKITHDPLEGISKLDCVQLVSNN